MRRDPPDLRTLAANPSTLVGVVAALTLAGCGADGPAEEVNADRPPAAEVSATTPPAEGTAAVDAPENFLWIFGRLYRDPAQFENLLAFAERHDLSIILAPASVTQTPDERAEIRAALRAAREREIPVLFNTGVFPERDGWPEGRVIVEDPEWRDRYEEALQRMAGLYLEEYPGGRVIVGHEDPLFSNWPHDDEENYRRYGARMFMIQRSAVKAVDPEAQVGIFVLPSHVLDMYRAFMPVLRAEGALPDFNMIDKYRGYSDARVGLDETNRQTRRLLSEARRMTDGAPIYLLSQDHTINTGYTPSRRAIREHIEAALAEGVDGMGWYIRTRYVTTEPISTLDGTVEPFLPNVGEVEEDRYSTFTGDRDRFMFAYLATFERQGLLDPDRRFDLWVHGTDLDLHEARVELRDTAGDWRFIGDIGAWVGGDNPYTLDDRTGAVIFRALDRATFLGDARTDAHDLEARVVADDSEDGLELRGIYAMPYTPTDRFITEGAAADSLARGAGSVRERSLARRHWPGGVVLGQRDTLHAVD